MHGWTGSRSVLIVIGARAIGRQGGSGLASVAVSAWDACSRAVDVVPKRLVYREAGST
jgi:hypothetical protein